MVIFDRIWKHFFIYSILLIALMTVIGFLSQWELENRLQDHLRNDALIFAKLVGKALPDSESPELLDPFCREYQETAGYRVTIINKDGRVIGESDRASIVVGSHLDRPEIREALRTGVGTSVRHSGTLEVEMLYTALLLQEEGRIVRIAIPMNEVMAFQNEVMIFFALALYLSPIMAILVAFFCTRHSIREQQRHG
jgi:two-component system phosphate regulon sensor histidine kinase PhoR